MTTQKGVNKDRQSGRDKKMQMGAALAGAAAGAILGAATGAALSDKSRRDKIGKKFGEFRDRAAEVIENAQDDLEI